MKIPTSKALAILLLITPMLSSEAAIYKCKNADGSITYSAIACPKGSAKKNISTISKKRQKQGLNRPKVALDDVKTVSDGLSNVLRNGFGNESLINLKEDYFNRDRRSTAKRLSRKGSLWVQYFRVRIDPNNDRGVFLEYTARRNKQNAGRLSDFEISRDEKLFDLSLMDMNVHAARIGLRNKAEKARAFGAKEIDWVWLEDGFKCTLKAKIDKKKPNKNHIKYQCKYQGDG